jgi:hypothetical protein
VAQGIARLAHHGRCLQAALIVSLRPALNEAPLLVQEILQAHWPPIEPSLFGDPTLVREWGRISHNGRRIIEIHENEREAAHALDF